MEKTIRIGDKEVVLRATAYIPRLYRIKFGRDMIQDMRQLQKAYRKATSLPEGASEEEQQDAQLSVMDLTIFEDVAYMMAKHADKTVPGSPDEWLDTLPGVFSVYEVLPEILELWGLSNQTTSVSKKN